ncbi:MAG: HD-GYP domain-containing protein [Candidatus Acidiferrales bacterium]
MLTNNIEQTTGPAVLPRMEALAGEPVFTASAFGKSSQSWLPATLQVKQVEEQISALRSSLICAFNQLLDLKDLNTGVHSTRLAEWALHVAGELGLEQNCLGDIEVAALLHDIGKIGIADAILNKPAKLTAEEYDLMKKHPEYGWAVLRQVPGMERASLIILHHHESYDGSGYPGGLKGEEIPMGSRIVAVIDAFDAMVSNRPYRQGLSFEEAERRLLQASGTQFDARVVNSFLPLARAEMASVFAAAGTTVSVVL